MDEMKCKSCGRIKSIESFGKSNAYKGGRRGDCKICVNTYQKEKRKLRVPESSDVMDLRLSATRPSDYCDTYDFLERIGYDLSKDISMQFCEKHGLRYVPRDSRSVNKTTPEDCLKMKNPS
jgi:hypothetical protein